MINNRQAGRRNRGRNNGRQNGSNRGGDNGNRIDSRARGNAPQLLEKYRNMARDAQLAGDRVSTEYYLQFADHYFRVIADNRARQEEHQARFRRNDEDLDDDGDQGDQRYDRAGSGEGPGEPVRVPNHVVADAIGDRDDRDEMPNQSAKEDSDGEDGGNARRGNRGRKPRQPRARVEVPGNDEEAGVDLAALPPSISRADNNSDDGEAPAAPRRRGRPRRVPAEAAE
ncbi:MAG: DUF4167 domain-containing protein [Sphingobium sp.]